MLLVWRHRQKCLDQSNHAVYISRQSMWPNWARKKCWGWGQEVGVAGERVLVLLLPGGQLWAPLCWCICRSAGITWWHKPLKCSKKVLRNQHNFRIIITWFFYLLTEYELICIRETCIGVEKFTCALSFIWGYYCWIQSFICSFHVYCKPAMCKVLC